MESAELSVKRKRIKSCFRRSEIYEHWINNPEYCYTNQKYNVSGQYDMLFSGSIKETETRQQFIKDWYYLYRNRCMAIINREYKLIIVNTEYNRFFYDLLHDVPNDYQVFLTAKPIDNPNILSTGEVDEAVKLHAEYSVSKFIEYNLSESYSVLKGFKKILHTDPKTIFKYNKSRIYNSNWIGYSYPNYNYIVDFVKKYNIKKTTWYSTPFKGNISIIKYSNWSRSKSAIIELPSIKQIITNKVFKSIEKIKLDKAYFYGKYCYGKRISIKTLEARWNDEYNREEFETLFKDKLININLDNRPELLYWKDGIKLYSKVLDNINTSSRNRAIEQSKNNYENALKELKEQEKEYNIDNWRNYQNDNRELSCECEQFIPDYRKNGYGVWKTIKIFRHINFPNTLLRIKYKMIETSKHASVTLEDAINMYKLFLDITKDDICEVGTQIYHKLDYLHYNIGNFNLRSIMYKKKKTDNGDFLDKWEYVINIGCHCIWMDDFYDFVNYYNLYKEFGITNNN